MYGTQSWYPLSFIFGIGAPTAKSSNFNAMDGAFEEERRKIWEILECPVCLQIVRPPVFLCSSGHHVCNKCKPRCNCCPVCRQGLTATRSMAVEHILNAISVPCQNSSWGCSSTVLLSKSHIHEGACKFTPYGCPADYCHEVVSQVDMVSHLKRCHINWKIVSVQLRGLHEFCYFGFFRVDFVNVFDVAEWGLFFLHCQKKRNGYYFFVTYLGNSEKASEYRFEVSAEDKEGMQRCSFEGRVEAYDTAFRDIVSRGSYLLIRHSRYRGLEDESSRVRYGVKVFQVKKEGRRITITSVQNKGTSPMTMAFTCALFFSACLTVRYLVHCGAKQQLTFFERNFCFQGSPFTIIQQNLRQFM